MCRIRSSQVINQEDIDKLLPATRPQTSDEGMGRKGKGNDANIVDPFGKRAPRRGLREKVFFFFFTLVTGLSRFLSLKLRVYKSL